MSGDPLGSQVQAQLITVRFATAEDVPGIVALVNYHARRGELLPRTTRSVYETLQDWIVALVPASGGSEILGCVSLFPYDSTLAEVRSLAVQERARGLGVGTHLMRALLVEAEQRRLSTLFALTRVVGFFLRCGFVPAERDRFPQKIWRDCWQCPFLERCDETAVVLEIGQ